MKLLVFAMNLMLFFVLLCTSCDTQETDTSAALVPLTVEEDSSIPSLNVNGYLLHVESYGNPTNPLLVIIHGGPGADFRSMLNARDLVDEGYFVVFYDQFGTGLSQRIDKEILDNEILAREGSIDVYFDNLRAIVNHFKQSDSQKVFFYGHSWGGMLAAGFANKYPQEVDGIAMSEPGGFTWTQTEDYVSRANEIKLFSEALNDAIYPEQIFGGKGQHEILDYKAAYFFTFENAEGNTIGNEDHYPFWRSGAAVAQASFEYADEYGFDFQNNLNQYSTKVLFAYSELNTAYGRSWAEEVAAPFPNVELFEVKDSGHEIPYFGWDNFRPVLLNYLNQLK